MTRVFPCTTAGFHPKHAASPEAARSLTAVELRKKAAVRGLLPHYPQWRRQVDLVPDLENPQDLFGGSLGKATLAA